MNALREKAIDGWVGLSIFRVDNLSTAVRYRISLLSTGHPACCYSEKENFFSATVKSSVYLCINYNRVFSINGVL